jgi:hypothetical protein
MSALDRPPRYRSYLLRCWEERGRGRDGAGTWRFSLEDPHTGRRRGFASLDDLVAAVRGELEPDGDEPRADAQERR